MPVRATDCDVIINLKGFSVPRIEDFRLLESVDKPMIINKKEEVIVLKTYGLQESSNINYRDIILVDSKKIGDFLPSVRGELKSEDFDFIRFWIRGFTICYRKTDMKILYYDLGLLTDFRSKNEIMKEVLFDKKKCREADSETLGPIALYRPYYVKGARGAVYDSNSDGVFESLCFISSENLAEDKKYEEFYSENINKIVSFVCTKKNELLASKNLLFAWEYYQEKPSSESAIKFLDALPTQSIDKRGILFRPDYLQLKKRIEERGEKVETITPYEKSVWLFIENNLAFIKRQAYLGDQNAVRILFKFYRLFYHSYLFQGKIDIVLDELSLINPALFLKILNENSDLDLVILLDTYVGLDFVNETNDRYANIKNKIDVFNKVSDSTLTQIRDKCLNALIKIKKEIEESGLLIRAAN